jgi:hypothetical protein
MKNFHVLTTSLILSTLALASCSTNKMASTAAQDNLYFMASDTKMSRSNAVPNNKPESFQNLSTINSDSFEQENFSSRNVNPDYIAKYQSESKSVDEETVYFEEGTESAPNIDVYNNYYSAAPGSFGGFNNSFNSGLGFGGFGSPFGFGMNAFGSPFGMGMNGFGSPFGYGMGGFGMGGFGGPFGFGPRMSMSMNMALNFGSPWMGNSMFYGMPMMGFGMPMMGFGMPMMGYGFGFNRFPGYAMGFPNFGNQIYVLPGGEYSSRGASVGVRPSRGASFAGAAYRPNVNSAAIPSTARAQARNAALNNSSSSRTSSGNETSRASSRDFSTSQNDYYSNSRSRVATDPTRNVNSPAADRSGATRSRSAMPSANPSNVNSNTRTSTGSINAPSRSSSSTSPSYNRSNASPSYNRSTASPSYNRSSTSTPSRSSSGTSNYNAPSRSSSGRSTLSAPSSSSFGTSGYSAPSRSSGGSIGGSSGGSSSGGGRSGRGN